MRRQNNLLPLLVVGGLLLVLAGACYLTQDLPRQSSPLAPTFTFTSQPSPLPATQAASPTEQPPVPGGLDASAHPEIARVSLEEAKAAFDAKTALFIDVRGDAAYAISHIPGALDIPYSQVETSLKGFDPNQWIIPYCT